MCVCGGGWEGCSLPYCALSLCLFIPCYLWSWLEEAEASWGKSSKNWAWLTLDGAYAKDCWEYACHSQLMMCARRWVLFSLSDLSHYQKAPQLPKKQVSQSFLCFLALTGVASQVLLLLVTVRTNILKAGLPFSPSAARRTAMAAWTESTDSAPGCSALVTAASATMCRLHPYKPWGTPEGPACPQLSSLGTGEGTFSGDLVKVLIFVQCTAWYWSLDKAYDWCNWKLCSGWCNYWFDISISCPWRSWLLDI